MIDKLTDSKLNQLSTDKLFNYVHNPEKLSEHERYNISQFCEGSKIVYQITKNEIEDLFSLKEILLLMDSLNGVLYSFTISPKEHITYNVLDAIKYEDLDKKWEVNKEVLINKLNNLTEMQAFTLKIMINELWESASLDTSLDITVGIKELFDIK